VSTGLGSCIAAAVYELGRPRRLSVDEAQALEAQWQHFGAFRTPPPYPKEKGPGWARRGFERSGCAQLGAGGGSVEEIWSLDTHGSLNLEHNRVMQPRTAAAKE
jgi:hypothetical protein